MSLYSRLHQNLDHLWSRVSPPRTEKDQAAYDGVHKVFIDMAGGFVVWFIVSVITSIALIWALVRNHS